MQNTATTLTDNNAGQLGEVQLERLQQAAESLNSAQLNWASGYLAGLCAAPSPAKQNVAAASMTILYATQGGNAQCIATELANNATALAYPARVESVNAYRVRELAKEKILVVVISTQGDGDPPESAQELIRYLSSNKHAELNGLNYAVFGLGDSSYEFFCKAGRDLDSLLQDRGARPLLQRVDADVDFHSHAVDWYADLLKEVEPILDPALNPILEQAESRVAQLPRQSAVSPVSTGHDRNHPITAEIIDTRTITTADAHTSVQHLSLAIDPQLVTYRPGDVLGVWFRNDPELVDAVLHLTGLDAKEPVEIQGQSQSLGEALASRLELTQLHPLVVKAWSGLTGNSTLAGLVQDSKKLRAFATERQFIDLLHDYPGEIDAANLVTTLQPVQPRLYSIASSQASYEDEIHLTVSNTQYQAHGREHLGAASGYLTRRIDAGDEIQVYIAENPAFSLPDDGDTPLILIGTGSGIAPYRAFLQEREAIGATGPVWLVFGNRNFHRDFLYQSDWLKYRKAGLLERVSLAFSRDTNAPAYVQDRLAEEGADLFRWLQEGARIYVCGCVAMEKGVSEALHGIIAQHGGMSAESATQYVEDLHAGKRYLRDVY
jgi:sulfite reductase (NADPH) flavoprotein alpha-component